MRQSLFVATVLFALLMSTGCSKSKPAATPTTPSGSSMMKDDNMMGDKTMKGDKMMADDKMMKDDKSMKDK